MGLEASFEGGPKGALGVVGEPIFRAFGCRPAYPSCPVHLLGEPSAAIWLEAAVEAKISEWGSLTVPT